MIPAFQANGLLPPGDYNASFAELRQSVLVTGLSQPVSPNWDMAWRGHLVDNLEIMVKQLWSIGITEIFADGSFAEDKDHPNDIDGYFVCDFDQIKSGDLTRQLNLLDPHKIWTWDPLSRMPHPGFAKKQLPMWHQYRVELYPHVVGMPWGSGIRDQHGNELEFPSAFRQSRGNGAPRGIVKIQPGGGGHNDSE
jgi:hypothetical protein